MVSPIVTRGYGPRSRIITRGYGAVFIPAVAAAAHQIVGGAKRKLKEYHEDVTRFTVKAMFLSVNSKSLIDPIAGTSEHEIIKNDTRVIAVFRTINRLGYLTERIIINAFRVVRRGFKKIED